LSNLEVRQTPGRELAWGGSSFPSLPVALSKIFYRLHIRADAVYAPRMAAFDHASRFWYRWYKPAA
jgi:hypothetical protein